MLTRQRIPATRVEGGTMAWERGKRKRREGSESDEGLGNVAVKVLVERRRMVNRAQDEEMALAITVTVLQD